MSEAKLCKTLKAFGFASDGRGAAPLPRDVDLSRRGLSEAVAKRLSATLKSTVTLHSLKLGYNRLKDGGAAAVARAVAAHLSLNSLDLGFNDIGDAGAESLAAALASNTSLTTLYLSGNSIGLPGARSLAEAFQVNGTLVRLHLTGNNLGPAGAAALAEGIVGNQTLKSLYIGGCGVGATGACDLSAALARNAGLEALYLSHNDIGDDGLSSLAQALQVKRNMKVLELGFNGITPRGAAALVHALWGYPTLEELFLDNNRLGDDGAKRLADCVATIGLRHLEISFNGLGKVGIAAIMHVVVSHPRLQALALSGNVLDAEGARAVAVGVKYSKALKKLYLDHTMISQTGETLIARAALDNPHLQLQVITGFQLARVYRAMDMVYSPSEDASNEAVLTEVTAMIRQHYDHRTGDAGDKPAAAAAAAADEDSAPESLAEVKQAVAVVTEESAESADGASPSLPFEDEPTSELSATEGGDAEDATSATSATDGAQERPQKRRADDALAIATGQPIVPKPRRPRLGAVPFADAQSRSREALLDEADAAQPRPATAKEGKPRGMPRDRASTGLLSELGVLKEKPYDEAELWGLHQYYFSPLQSCGISDMSEEESEERPLTPPSKRPRPNSTKTRMDFFPRLKEKISGMADQRTVLLLLRQLRHMEKRAAMKKPMCELDVEQILLEMCPAVYLCAV